MKGVHPCPDSRALDSEGAKAVLLLETYEWVSDGVTYMNRSSAQWRCRQMREACERVTKDDRQFRGKTWRSKTGQWNWAIAYRKI